MKTVKIFGILVALFCVVLYGCNKASNGENQVNLCDSDIIGDYTFTGYTTARCDLEVSFVEDHSGYYTETRYLSSRVSAKAMSFIWSISGDRVILSGIRASADSDGDWDINTSATQEFKYAYGMLLPGKGFIDGYAKHEIFNMIEQKINDYVDNTATFEESTGYIYIDITSKLDVVWPGMTFKFGFSENNNEWQYKDLESNHVRFCLWTEACLYIASIAELNKREREEGGLDKNAQDARDAYEYYLKEYIKSFERGNIDCRVGVQVGVLWHENGVNVFERVIETDFDKLSVKEVADVLTEPDNNEGASETAANCPRIEESGPVDMGLSVKWSAYNMGAHSPEEYGNYYAWGEVNTKTAFTWGTYKWCDDKKYSDPYFTKYNTDPNRNSGHAMCDDLFRLELEDDVAFMVISNNWRIPTAGEVSQLISSCTWVKTKYKGVEGFAATSKKTGKSLFFPCDNTEKYWASDLDMSNTSRAYTIYFSDDWDKPSPGSIARATAALVRPVRRQPVPSTDSREAVDLGLSVKWANMNIDAMSKYDKGGYYAWGETKEKAIYSWATYKWANGSWDTITKYEASGSVLEPLDDVASVKWGNGWRMPTQDELGRLLTSCQWNRVGYDTEKGWVFGYQVTGSNGNSIFLPAAGTSNGENVGRYWTSTGLYAGSARQLFIDPTGEITPAWGAPNRCYGFTVRAVKD